MKKIILIFCCCFLLFSAACKSTLPEVTPEISPEPSPTEEIAPIIVLPNKKPFFNPDSSQYEVKNFPDLEDCIRSSVLIVTAKYEDYAYDPENGILGRVNHHFLIEDVIEGKRETKSLSVSEMVYVNPDGTPRFVFGENYVPGQRYMLLLKESAEITETYFSLPVRLPLDDLSKSKRLTEWYESEDTGTFESPFLRSITEEELRTYVTFVRETDPPPSQDQGGFTEVK